MSAINLHCSQDGRITLAGEWPVEFDATEAFVQMHETVDALVYRNRRLWFKLANGSAEYAELRSPPRQTFGASRRFVLLRGSHEPIEIAPAL